MSARMRTLPGGATSWKWPSSSVVAVVDVPTIVTMAPASGASRSGDSTVPLMMPVVGAGGAGAGGGAGSAGTGAASSGCAYARDAQTKPTNTAHFTRTAEVSHDTSV